MIPKKKKKKIEDETVRIDPDLFNVDGLSKELELDDDLELLEAIEEEEV